MNIRVERDYKIITKAPINNINTFEGTVRTITGFSGSGQYGNPMALYIELKGLINNPAYMDLIKPEEAMYYVIELSNGGIVLIPDYAIIEDQVKEITPNTTLNISITTNTSTDKVIISKLLADAGYSFTIT